MIDGGTQTANTTLVQAYMRCGISRSESESLALEGEEIITTTSNGRDISISLYETIVCTYKDEAEKYHNKRVSKWMPHCNWFDV